MRQYVVMANILAVVCWVIILSGPGIGWAQVSEGQGAGDLDELQNRLDRLSEAAERQLRVVDQRGEGIAVLTEAIENLLAVTGELRSDKAHLLSERSSLSEELHRARSESSVIVEKKRALGLENASLEALVHQAKSDLSTREDQILRLENDAIRSNEALKLADKKISGQFTRIEKLEERLAAVVNEAREKDSNLRATNERLDALVGSLTEQLREVNETLFTSTATISEQDAEIVALKQGLAAVDARRLMVLEKHRRKLFDQIGSSLDRWPGLRTVDNHFVFQSDALFVEKTATLNDQAIPELNFLAEALKDMLGEISLELPWLLRVDGHTDSQSVDDLDGLSHLKLSWERATSVVNFLISRGIPGEHLAVAGFGDNYPIDDREDEIGYRRNGRIELTLTLR